MICDSAPPGKHSALSAILFILMFPKQTLIPLGEIGFFARLNLYHNTRLLSLAAIDVVVTVVNMSW